MKQNNPHLIQSANFRVAFSDRALAFQYQDKLPEMFSESIIPALNQALDRFAPKDRLVKLDRLDIDLGTLPPGISKSELERIILRQVLIALRKLKSHEYEIKDETRHTLESYLTYIKTGRFQYDTAAFTLEEMERLIRKLSPQETQWLEPELKSSLRSENVRKRIIFQHSEDFISWLARRFIPRYQDLLTRLLPDTVTGYSDDFYRKDFILFCLAHFSPSEDLKSFNKEFPAVKDLYSKKYPAIQRPIKKTDLQRDSDSDTLTPSRATKDTFPETQPSEEDIEEGTLVIYTGNAGIVLIHPFLSEFFGKLGLLDNARLFTNIDSAVRGIFLLHFLATGTTELEEFQSGLYKILCGIPLGQAIPRNLNLFKEELEESETLLRSAIGHWKILKNTSPNGLRETFFQREGKLEITDQGWILKVEQRSVDILISHLPWTYSIVKLPWMDQTLWVEWA